MKRILIVLTTLLLFTNINSQVLKKVTFVPHWVPQAQFAGYYVANDLGFYKKYGIDLTIITGGPKVSSSSLLEREKVDFALMWLSNAIQLRARNIKVVNIAQMVNRSALMLISKKSSGIKTPQDMNGKKVGIWGGDFQIQPLAFFKKYNINAKTIMQGNSINLFFFDGIDVTSAMWYNEYHSIINSGIDKDELNTFFFADYGLNFPEEGIYCSEKFYNENPELCRKFLEATYEGWKYAFEHPDEAVELILKHIRKENLPINKSHQSWMLARMKDLIFPSSNTNDFEMLQMDNYLLVAKQLYENKLIDHIPSYYEVYKPIKLSKEK
jgi:NitT/TauT family transport system substrate-binding protein